MDEYIKRHQAAYRSRTGQVSETQKQALGTESTPSNTIHPTHSNPPNNLKNPQNCDLEIDLDELAKTDPDLASEILCRKLQEEMGNEARVESMAHEDYVRPPDSSFSECLFGGSSWRASMSRSTLSQSQNSEHSNVDSDEHDENLQAAIGQSLIEM